MESTNIKPIVLFLTSYPSRPCGIATFSQDLISAINDKVGDNYELQVCALENSDGNIHTYSKDVIYRLNTKNPDSIVKIGEEIRCNSRIKLICLQHEFGLWGGEYGSLLLDFLPMLKKPIVTVFHTVLPLPDKERKLIINKISQYSEKLLVMTNSSSELLQSDYDIKKEKIQIIPHGTHHVSWNGQFQLKKTYGYEGRIILSTFGLLGPNKNIETTILALAKLVKTYPQIHFLVLGQTHPELVKIEGEVYRTRLEQLVENLSLQNHVEFINEYLSLQELLAYLQLTDIYVFSSKDPNQAVSGTFVYAMSCGCPVISTPIPHAIEALDKKSGKFFAFENHKSLAEKLRPLLRSESKRKQMALHAYQKTRPTRWANVALAYHNVFQEIIPTETISYKKPAVKIDHLLRLTDKFGIIQFSKIDKPDKSSGYTIDDNARALIAMVMYYRSRPQDYLLKYITTYLDFILFCQKTDGSFQNYVDLNKEFHHLNNYVNLEDSNGRAIWALGFLIANGNVLPDSLVEKAENCLVKTAPWLSKTKSPRAIAFVIKGLYYYHQKHPNDELITLMSLLANKIVDRYVATASDNWIWFENSLTYANSILPEAMILAYDLTKKPLYRNIGIQTFNFLLSHLFEHDYLRVISNRGWFERGKKPSDHGEQPIDVTYTIQTLKIFHQVLNINRYKLLADKAFSWFLGYNQLKQVMYDPITGGCYDGLEKENVNLNQGAESTVCFLIARLLMDDHKISTKRISKDSEILKYVKNLQH